MYIRDCVIIQHVKYKFRRMCGPHIEISFDVSRQYFRSLTELICTNEWFNAHWLMESVAVGLYSELYSFYL